MSPINQGKNVPGHCESPRNRGIFCFASLLSSSGVITKLSSGFASHSACSVLKDRLLIQFFCLFVYFFFFNGLKKDKWHCKSFCFKINTTVLVWEVSSIVFFIILNFINFTSTHRNMYSIDTFEYRFCIFNKKESSCQKKYFL